jgi:hypothetical protein
MPKRSVQRRLGRSAAVRLRLLCRKSLDPREFGAVFGLQSNETAKEWLLTEGKQRSNGDVLFECTCQVRPNRRTGLPQLHGPFVHGYADQRFLYLSWRPTGWRPGKPAPPAPGWVRRLKVDLTSITPTQMRRAQKGGRLEASVPGTANDGGPSCALPLLGEGWTVR